MNVLMDDLPTAVTVKGAQIPIATDYRTGILFETLLKDPAVSDAEKLDTVLVLYYGDQIFSLLTDMEAVQEALDAIMWFYRCGADETEDPDEGGTGRRKDPAFAYEHDAPYIYAAFVEAYGIDLTKNRLHWWQFRALFLGLPETVLFYKIMGYRTMEIPAKMPKAQKRYYQRMKRIYRLPLSAEEISLEQEMNAILERGGDISHLLK